MREWADVFVPALDERLELGKKALFFVPKALERCSHHHLTVAHLGSLSSTAEIDGPRAGRNAISKVFKVLPVTYDSAVGVINVANHALRNVGGEELSTRDIIACVFRLNQLQEILSELKVSAAEMASVTGISKEVAYAAVQRYRVQLHDALAIWGYLRVRWREASLKQPLDNDVLTDLPQDFIKSDVRSPFPLAVRAVREFESVYRWDNLTPAPASGHYWALESAR